MHGAWVGAWFWSRVAPLLQRGGDEVLTPTLTGVGESAHLATRDVGLETHVQDVMDVLTGDDLRDVVLVGHSYAGMIVTAVAHRAPERLRHVIYLDAFVPDDGESVAQLVGPYGEAGYRELARMADGWRMPAVFPLDRLGVGPGDAAWMTALLTPQPLRTHLEPLRLEPEDSEGAGPPGSEQVPDAGPSAHRRRDVPRTFILCRRPSLGLFDRSAERARARGWAYRELEAGHAVPVTEPERVASLLSAIGRSSPTMRAEA